VESVDAEAMAVPAAMVVMAEMADTVEKAATPMVGLVNQLPQEVLAEEVETAAMAETVETAVMAVKVETVAMSLS
jgi:hypothetical protein